MHKERNIYEYTEGPEQLRLDPMAIQRKFTAYPDLIANLGVIQLAQELKPTKDERQAQENRKILADADKATAEVIEAVRKVFDLKPYNGQDETGWMDEEVIALFSHFCGWLDNLKKKQNPTPTLESFSDVIFPDSITKPSSAST
jgi:hypothetical protein